MKSDKHISTDTSGYNGPGGGYYAGVICSCGYKKVFFLGDSFSSQGVLNWLKVGQEFWLFHLEEMKIRGLLLPLDP